eukprot:Gb_14423 [translate_table: standard]
MEKQMVRQRKICKAKGFFTSFGGTIKQFFMDKIYLAVYRGNAITHESCLDLDHIMKKTGHKLGSRTVSSPNTDSQDNYRHFLNCHPQGYAGQIFIELPFLFLCYKHRLDRVAELLFQEICILLLFRLIVSCEGFNWVQLPLSIEPFLLNSFAPLNPVLRPTCEGVNLVRRRCGWLVHPTEYQLSQNFKHAQSYGNALRMDRLCKSLTFRNVESGQEGIDSEWPLLFAPGLQEMDAAAAGRLSLARPSRLSPERNNGHSHMQNSGWVAASLLDSYTWNSSYSPLIDFSAAVPRSRTDQNGWIKSLSRTALFSLPNSTLPVFVRKYWDCGLACVLMVLKALGIESCDMKSLGKLCSTTRYSKPCLDWKW